MNQLGAFVTLRMISMILAPIFNLLKVIDLNMFKWYVQTQKEFYWTTLESFWLGSLVFMIQSKRTSNRGLDNGYAVAQQKHIE